MSTDPLHGIFVLLMLVGIYTALAALAWWIACHGNHVAVRLLNAAISQQRRNSPNPHPEIAPDLEATIASLVAEKRLSAHAAARLRRITPVFHKGKWAVYPSNAYWAHRFERLKTR